MGFALALLVLLAPSVVPGSDHPASPARAPPVGPLPETLASGFAVTFVAPALNGSGKNYSFDLDGVTYQNLGGTETTVTGLSAGPHDLANISASPAMTGWRYEGSADTGPVFSEPGTDQVLLTFAYVNVTAPPITLVFQQTQLTALTSWSLLFNGTNLNSHGSEITFTGPPGYYERAYHDATNPLGQIQYRIDQNLTFLFYGANATITLVFTEYFEVGVFGTPGGSIRPSGIVWVAHAASLSIYAVGNKGYSFNGWTGVGPGNYTGGAPQQNITVAGPITEFAAFQLRTNASGVLHFYELGLPSGTIWTVTLNGVGYGSGLPLLVISNLIPCTSNLSSDPGNYSVTVPDVYRNQTIPGLSERYLPVSPPTHECGSAKSLFVTYRPQYLVLAGASAGGAISVTLNGSPARNTYVDPGASVEFQADATFGYLFTGWAGTGVGAYTGLQGSVAIPITGSVDEVASFGPGPTLLAAGYPVTFQVTSGPTVAPVWTVTLDGQAYAANGSELTVPDVALGPHAVVLPVVTGPGGTSRSVPDSSNFNVTVVGPTEVNVTFTTQYWLTITVYGPGSVTPGSGWVPAGSIVSLQGIPTPGARMLGWSSASAGGYSGNDSSTVRLQMSQPVIEVADFGPGLASPDFWHRSDDLLAAAAAGLVLGGVAIALTFRWWRRRHPPAPPRGATLTAAVERPGGDDDGPSLPSAREGPPPTALVVVLLLALLVAVPAITLLGTHPPAAGTPAPSGAVVLSGPPAPPSQGARPPPDRMGESSLASSSPAVPRPSGGGPTLSFTETGLPGGLVWTVSVWPFDTAANASLTENSSSTSLSFPLTATEVSVDFDIWTVYDPSSPTTVLRGTPDVPGPVAPNRTGNINVTFSAVAPASLSFRFHIAESGLPPGQSWQGSIEGAEYNFSQPATDAYLRHGDTFTFGATPIVSTADVEYVPSGFDVQQFNGSGGWSNVSAGPVVRLATADFWVGVEYNESFRVRFVAQQGGSVDRSTGWYPPGPAIVATATPKAGYQFVSWNGTGLGSVSSNDPVITFYPDSGVEEFASFAAVPNTVEVVETGLAPGEFYSLVYNGEIYSSNLSIWALPVHTVGQFNVSVPDIPSSQTVGERFVPVSITSTFPAGIGATFSVTGNGTIFLGFSTEYALTLTTSGPGTTDPASGSYWEPAGSVVAVRAFPNSSTLSLEQWSGTGSGSYSGNAVGILVTMNAPLTEDAQFGPPFPPTGDFLTVTEGGLPSGTTWSAAAGSLGASGSTSALTVGPLPPGAVTLTVAPVLVSPGERLSAAGGGAFQLALAGNTSLVVEFVPQFALNISVQFGGSVAAYPEWVAANESVTLLAEPPAPGYQFNGWNGTSNSTGALLTLTATGPIVLTAQFGPVPAAAATGPKDLAIAAADVGIPAAAGALATYLWLRRRR